jgi:hypothetical protein
LNICLKPINIFTKLVIIILVLLLINILGIVTKFYFGHDTVYGLIRLFDFDTENNIPTFFSSLVLIYSSLLLFIITTLHRKNGSQYLPWLGLALIFLFLSIDEIASIHERLKLPVREMLNPSGLLYFAWVIPYGIATAIIVAIYFRFVMNLPKRILVLFVISGLTFVSGAIGLELLGGRHYELHGPDNIVYLCMYTCEEFLEMSGSAIFVYSLLLYMSYQFKPLTISISK